MSTAGRPPDARDRLAAARADATAQITSLARDLEQIIGSSIAANNDDEHDPEGPTIAFERAQIAALLSQARRNLAELDLAWERWSHGAYGRCERCGQPIPAERLAIRPAARTCVGCA